MGRALRIAARLTVFAAFFTAILCAETIITVDTAATGWTITQLGVYDSGLGRSTLLYPNLAAFHPPSTTDISVTDTSRQDGTLVAPGFAASDFIGFWVAEFTFDLPVNAINVALNYHGLYGDDRAVLLLNDTEIANMTWDTGPGRMDRTFAETQQGTYTDYNFTTRWVDPTADGGVAFNANHVVTSGFVPGQNTLKFIVNNTGNDALRTVPTAGFQAAGDASMANLVGAVSYDLSTPTPEPGTVSLLVLGTVAIAFRKAVVRR
jgi:hypothetical protein